MSDAQKLEITVPAERERSGGADGANESLRAAAVEAAYILEAVRK